MARKWVICRNKKHANSTTLLVKWIISCQIKVKYILGNINLTFKTKFEFFWNTLAALLWKHLAAKIGSKYDFNYDWIMSSPFRPLYRSLSYYELISPKLSLNFNSLFKELYKNPSLFPFSIHKRFSPSSIFYSSFCFFVWVFPPFFKFIFEKLNTIDRSLQ